MCTRCKGMHFGKRNQMPCVSHEHCNSNNSEPSSLRYQLGEKEKQMLEVAAAKGPAQGRREEKKKKKNRSIVLAVGQS